MDATRSIGATRAHELRGEATVRFAAGMADDLAFARRTTQTAWVRERVLVLERNRSQ